MATVRRMGLVERRVMGILGALVWWAGCGGNGTTTTEGSTDATDGTGSTGVQSGTTAPDPTTTGLPPTTGVTTVEPTGGFTGDPTTGDPTVGDTTGGSTGDNTTGNTTDTTGVVPFCGDGMVDPGEACDDGANNGPGQACNAMCASNTCGDGDAGPGEQCDDGANNGDTNSCKSDCTNAVCGDGLVGPGEGCDDGNMVDNDECGNDSSFPATAPTRQLTSKLHGRNRWVFPRAAIRPPPPSPRACPPGLEKSRRRVRRGRDA